MWNVKVLEFTKTTSTWTTDSKLSRLLLERLVLSLVSISRGMVLVHVLRLVNQISTILLTLMVPIMARFMLYDFDGTSFTPFGTNPIVGLNTDKLGFSLDLSDDGTTLVIGSPNSDEGGDPNDNTGDVKGMLCRLAVVCCASVVLSRVSHSSLSLFHSSILQSILSITGATDYEFQQTIVGDATDAGFGRFIHVSSDGSQFLSASNPAFNSDGGQVKVYELSSGTWTEVAEFLGAANDELTSAAMTADGSRIALGSVSASTKVFVELFAPLLLHLLHHCPPPPAS